MSQDHSALLFKQEGDKARAVDLSVKADGSLRMLAHDMGKLVQEVWGEDEYEYWVDVPAAAVQELAFVLLRAAFSGRERAVDEFRAFCEEEKIEHTFANWV
jgi:hypothetical protein